MIKLIINIEVDILFIEQLFYLSTSTFKIDDSNCRHQKDKRTNEKGVYSMKKIKRQKGETKGYTITKIHSTLYCIVVRTMTRIQGNLSQRTFLIAFKQ